jgi:predicted ATPase
VIHLRGVRLLPSGAGQVDGEGYPFTVPAVAALRAAPLEFDAPVTFLVGENGSGKSAILEGLACAAGSIAIAGDDPRRDPTLIAARALGDRLIRIPGVSYRNGTTDDACPAFERRGIASALPGGGGSGGA